MWIAKELHNRQTDRHVDAALFCTTTDVQTISISTDGLKIECDIDIEPIFILTHAKHKLHFDSFFSESVVVNFCITILSEI